MSQKIRRCYRQVLCNSASASGNPSVDSLVVRGGVAGSVGSASMTSMLPRAAAASKNASGPYAKRVSKEPPVSSASIFAMDTF